MAEGEKAFIGNLALHNVLENINPEYLKLKKMGEEVNSTNSLGAECVQGLISLGYWRKCVFLMDYVNSLAVCSTFGDFSGYKFIYLTGNQKFINDSKSLEKVKIKKE